jgi:hypothetical protein
MRITIEKGYQPRIKELMATLQTDDPKLAVHHIIGCWLAANGCSGHSVAAGVGAIATVQPASNDEFDIIPDWS